MTSSSRRPSTAWTAAWIALAALALALGPGTARAQDALEVVAELPRDIPPGNVAVTPAGRVLLSLHQFFGPSPYRVVELLPGGTIVPFPSEAWASPPGPDGVGLSNVLGLNSDARGVVWILDAGGQDQGPKLIGWDSVADRLERVIALAPPAVTETSFLNDVAIDPVHDFAAIADTGRGDSSALIVVDLATGQAVRRLAGHPALVPEDVDMVIDGRVIARGGTPVRVGLNPITIDPTYERLIFGPMSGTTLYQVATTDLFDLSLSEEDLAERVARYGDKPVCDGITVDAAGNVYVSDVMAGAVGVTGPGGDYRVLLTDPRLSFPVGFAVGPGGWIYVVADQLHRSPPLNDGVNGAEPPFYVLRFRALGPAVVGR